MAAGGGPAYNPYPRLSNYTYVQQNEPTDPQEGETWYNTANNEFKQYDGEQWQFYPITGSGFSMGGYDELSYLSTVDRFDFPFEFGFAAHVGDLTVSRWRAAGVNSSTHGYCIGGNRGVDYITTVDRFEFPFGHANKMASLDPKRLTGEKAVIEATKNENLTDTGGNLDDGTAAAASCNSSTNAYMMGGETRDDAIIDNINRFSFPFDMSITTNSGKLSLAKKHNTGWNDTTHGYAVGGIGEFTPFESDLIETFQYAGNVGEAVFAGNLSSSKAFMVGVNSTKYGYTFGGYKKSTADTPARPYLEPAEQMMPQEEIERFEFNQFAVPSILAGQLNTSRFASAAVSSTTRGYVMGGTESGHNIIGSSEFIDFPFDSGFAKDAGVLSNRRRYHTATDNTDFIAVFK